jgi:hypothetical protein
MKHPLFALMILGIAVVFGVLLGGCVTTGTATTPGVPSQALQNAVTGFCAIAPSELAALQANPSALPVQAQADLQVAQQGVTTLCAPGVVASAANLQTFAQVVLPAFTVLALEFAQMQQKTKAP